MRNKGNTMTCQKCKKVKADIKYHGGHYCTWYCAKKKKVESTGESFHELNGMLKEQHDFDMAMNNMEVY